MTALWQKIIEVLKLSRMKKRWQSLARILAFAVVFCTTYMLILPAITMEHETYCGIEDHIHTEECYLKLRPEMGPDGETSEIWEETVSGVTITSDASKNILNIARSQLGYKESELNFTVDENGVKNAYTRYGQWYGNPYGSWNTVFASFCLHYAKTENAGHLMNSGASGMRYSWENDGLFADSSHTPLIGNIVFTDSDTDGVCDTVGIVSEVSESSIKAVFGDVNGEVSETAVTEMGTVLGYGLSEKLSVKGYAVEEDENPTEDENLTEDKNIGDKENFDEGEEGTDRDEPIMQAPMSPNLTLNSSSSEKINHTSELHDHVISVNIYDKTGAQIDNGSTVFIGERYNISLEFGEDNEGTEWTQFEYNEDGYLTYQIPSGLKCKAFDDWHPITAKTSTGTVENVGEYFIDETGFLKVRFYEVDDGHGSTLNFIDKYSNTHFFIDFEATVANSAAGSDTVINFGQEIEVDLKLDGSAGMNVTKTHGKYNQVDNTIDYTIKVETTHGVIRDLVLDDEIWSNYKIDRSTIVVTDLEGNLITPQPTVSNHPSHNSGSSGGCRISGFPDLPAGEGFLITYEANILENVLENNSGEEISLWNGLDANGKNGNGENVHQWAEDWIGVRLHNLKKEGQMKKIEDENGDEINVLEWVVREGNGETYIDSAIIIDTLGGGLHYYKGEPIEIRVKNGDGSYTYHYLDWNEVTETDTSIRFDLPPGYEYKIVYYTTYDPLADGEAVKAYHNTVKSVIHGNESTVEGSGVIVDFDPEVHKAASGEDGEYVYYTIWTDVPGSIKDLGHFHFTDTIAFWNYPVANVHTYVENIPENLVVTATKKDGTVITFTPYVEGESADNTYMLLCPSPEGNNLKYHSFDMLFNTGTANFADSKWIIDEDTTLTVSYKIPFSAKTDTAWYSPPGGDKTLGDILAEDKIVSNEVYFNFTEQAYTATSVTYSYNPSIEKTAQVDPEGYIDYTVVFHNTVPGSGGDVGYLNNTINEIIFNDTFDERLEYVEGSLTVTGYDPWRDIWLCKYRYEGSANGNSLVVNAEDMKFIEYNYAEAQYDANGNKLWGTWLSGQKTFKDYIHALNNGGDHVYTYRLKVKDEYKLTTEYASLDLDNTAEVTWDNGGSSGPVSNTSTYHTGLIDKHVLQDDAMLDFNVYINRNGLDMVEDLDVLTIEDEMSDNLSLYWDSIKLYYKDVNGNWIDFDSPESVYECTVRYAQETNLLTFIIPDELPVRIDYTTLITNSGLIAIKNNVSVKGKAYVSDLIEAEFHVEEHSGGASGSVHDITLLKQDGTTGANLPNASFLLYGPVGAVTKPVPDGYDRDIQLSDGSWIHFIGYYTTGADGTIKISSQYLNYGGPFMLVEAVAPEGYDILSEPTFFYYYNDDPNGEIPTVTTLIAVENYRGGYILPATGGIGTTPLYITGGLLISLSTVFLLCYRKKDKERRRKHSEG